MDERALTRLAYDVYQENENDYHIANSYTLSGCGLTADDVLRLSSELHTEYSGTEQWVIPARTCDKMRWWRHCAKEYSVSPRKVRKCVLRKRDKRRKRERGRYL